jgi:hypothetical protein
MPTCTLLLLFVLYPRHLEYCSSHHYSLLSRLCLGRLLCPRDRKLDLSVVNNYMLMRGETS